MIRITENPRVQYDQAELGKSQKVRLRATRRIHQGRTPPIRQARLDQSQNKPPDQRLDRPHQQRERMDQDHSFNRPTMANMATRNNAASRKAVRVARANGGQREREEFAIIGRDEIEPHIDEVRARHPLITDFQAEVVRLIVHTGMNANQIAAQLQCDSQKVRYHMDKDHVGAYRQELAIKSLGWDAIFAQRTLVSLLQDKSSYVRLEAAKDIASRAGLSMERASTPAVAVQLNFGVTTPQVALAKVEPVADTQPQMGPATVSPGDEAFEKGPAASGEGAAALRPGSGNATGT